MTRRNRAGPFSPDGRWLIVTRSFATSHQELWLVDLEGNDAPRLLTDADQQAQYQRPEWSPDGSALYVLTDIGQEFSAPARLDIASGKLTYLMQARGRHRTRWPSTRAGRRLAYARNCDGAAEIIIRDLSSQQRATRRGPAAGRAVRLLAARAGLESRWLAAGNRVDRLAGQPQRLDCGRTASRPGRSRSRARWTLDGEQLVEPEHVTYPTFDGRQIPALLYAPSNSSAKPPCVVFVHGGPEGQFRPNFQPLVQYLVVGRLRRAGAQRARQLGLWPRRTCTWTTCGKRMDSVADLAHAVYWLRDSGRADPAADRACTAAATAASWCCRR